MFCNKYHFSYITIVLINSKNISDKVNQESCKLVSVIKTNKHSLTGNLFSEKDETVEDKLELKNAVLFYHLEIIFHVSSLHKKAFRHIERFFSILIETKCFKELDVSLISKLLASSNLQIYSEVEVCNAAILWLSYNINERSKFAKLLLTKVHVNFFSYDHLKYLLNESCCISESKSCIELIKKIINNRLEFFGNDISTYNKKRRHNNSIIGFSICGGYNKREKKSVSEVKVFDVNNLNKTTDIPPIIKVRCDSKSVYLKGELYVFGGYCPKGNHVKSVEKYSFINKRWSVVADVPGERQKFCTCAFIDKIYIFGGIYSNIFSLNSCSSIALDTKNSKWSSIEKMNEERKMASCAVFEERIIVSGGRNRNYPLNTVESYDVFTDTWKTMPYMIERRCGHSLVRVKRKLFVVGGALVDTNCEIFDTISNRFVSVHTPYTFYSYQPKAVSVGSKIFVLQNFKKDVLCYDSDKDTWSKKVCEPLQDISSYSCVRVPFF